MEQVTGAGGPEPERTDPADVLGSAVEPSPDGGESDVEERLRRENVEILQRLEDRRSEVRELKVQIRELREELRVERRDHEKVMRRRGVRMPLWYASQCETERLDRSTQAPSGDG